MINGQGYKCVSVFFADHCDKDDIKHSKADYMLHKYQEDMILAAGGGWLISVSELVSSIQASPARIHGICSLCMAYFNNGTN